MQALNYAVGYRPGVGVRFVQDSLLSVGKTLILRGGLTSASFKEEGILNWCLKRLRPGHPKMCSTVRGSLMSQWSHESGKRFDKMWECVSRVWSILSLKFQRLTPRLLLFGAYAADDQ